MESNLTAFFTLDRTHKVLYKQSSNQMCTARTRSLDIYAMGPATAALEGQCCFKERLISKMTDDNNVPLAFCFDQMVWSNTTPLQQEEEDSFPAITWDLDDEGDDFALSQRAQHIPTLSNEINTFGNIIIKPKSRPSNLVSSSTGMVRSKAFTFGLDSMSMNEAKGQNRETHTQACSSTFQSGNTTTGNVDLQLCFLSSLSRSKQLDSRIIYHDSFHAAQRMLV